MLRESGPAFNTEHLAPAVVCGLRWPHMPLCFWELARRGRIQLDLQGILEQGIPIAIVINGSADYLN